MYFFCCFLTSFATLLLATSAAAQSNPLWENTALDAFPISGIGHEDEAPPEPESMQTLALSVPAIVDAEIESLATALDNDPVKIFNYVRNNIDYQAYHGLRKGAALTLLEGAGNDFDQCVLLGELLTAAGYTDFIYSYRGHRIDYDYLVDWIGLAEEPFPGQTYYEAFGQAITETYAGGTDNGVGDYVAKRASFGGTFLSSRGLDGHNGSAAVWYPDFPSTANLVIKRVFLTLTYNGTPYDLDPSYKTYETIDGVDGILAAAGYDRAQLLSIAGGSTGTGYVQSLNDANIGAYLTTLNGDLLAELEQSYPGISIRELVSGRRVAMNDINDLSEAFPLPAVFFGTPITWSAIPSTLKTSVRFQAAGIDQTLYTSDLDGRKISLTFNGNTVELRLDDSALVDTASVSTGSFSMTVTVKHPGNLGSKSETKTYKKNNAFAYAILYGFSPSGRLLRKRHEQLNAYLDEGKGDDSREVRTELLNIMGLTWLYQTQMSDQILAAQNGVSHLSQHRFGRMAQEEGFYVDVGLALSGSRTRDGVDDDGRKDNVFHLGSLYASALEHGIIEQMQPGVSAVSTVNIIRRANEDGQPIYRADDSNWTTVRTELDAGGYPEATLINDFDKFYDPQHLDYRPETKLLLPRDYSVQPKLPDGTDGNWIGSGWVIRNNTSAGMIISGGYSGGYSYWPPNTGNHYVSSPPIHTSSYSNPSYTYSAPSMPSLKPLPSLPTLPKMYGSDPVDMATGAFIYANVDLETGTEPAPRGLSFSRHYSSNVRNRASQNLGYGWTHPAYIRAHVRTATEEALGLGTIQHAAALLTSTLVGSDLYRPDASVKEWGVATLTVGWFLDQMTDNAVSVTIGPDTFQFIKQPDGSYSAPAGSTMELTETGGNFVLKQRLGNALHFEVTEDADDDGQRIHKIIDPDGKEMVFHYYGDDRLDYIEDAYGRTYTFAYDSENRIDQITDSTGRDVRYRYDSHGNLDRFTDPEGKHFYFVYEAATDPDGIAPADPSLTGASEHRIVRMRNHDKEIVTQNVWDPLGRVVAQYLHGDTEWTWKMSYTGPINYEEDPEGGVTAYLYDERGRSAGKIDADGNKMTRRYDGQDRIVERVSGTGEITIYHYDTFHNLEQIEYSGGGGSTINEYDALHRLVKTVDPEENVTELLYFAAGFNAGKNRPQYLVDPAGTTTFTYFESGPGAGMVQTITDEDNLVTENGYDAYGQPAWTEAPGGIRTTFTYTARGDLDYVDDPNTIRTDYTYNDRRQVTQVVSDAGGPDAATENRAYDNQGRLQSVQAPAHNGGQRVEESFTYTPTDHLSEEFLVNETASISDDLVADYRYDGRDWNDLIFDSAGRELTVHYFANGEIDNIERPAARTAAFLYDADNRLVSRSKPGTPADRTYGYAYGETLLAEGNITEGYPRSVFTDADELTTTTEFNRLGQPRYYHNKSNHTFEFRYDGLGRRTHSITPLDAVNSRATLTTYNHRGEVTTLTEPSGETAVFGYHPTTGRLEFAAYSDGTTTETVNYTLYDSNGNLKTLNEGADTISRTYDNLNRVTSYTDVNGQTIGYRYYESGDIAKIIYPGGTESGVGHVEYTYWKTGRLKEVIDKLDSTTDPRITTTYWNDDGRLDRIVRPNGTVRKVKYDSAGRPEIVEEHTSGGQLITLYKNSYFPSDDVEWVYQLPQSQTFGAKPAVVEAMTYNIDNQLATFEGQPVTHDPDGNMTHGPLPDGSFGTYVFDIRNRLKSAGGLSYGYDPEDERVSLTDGTDTTTYVNENNLGLTKVLERTKDSETTRYVWGVGLLYEVDSSGEATYYHYDNYGSTTALTDETEAVTDRWEYSPFGHVTYREGDHDTPFLFTGFFGNQTDDNGLIHMRARFYNPLIRRFVNSDPAKEGWNWYAYAAGNPLGFVDPTGLGNAAILDAVQTGLSFLGMAPVAGFIPDVANSVISVARGNYADAAIHLAAAVPGFGQAVTGAKFATAGLGVFGAVKAVDRMGDAGRTANRAFGFTDELGVSSQAARRHLRSSVPGSGGQVHHIIAWEARGHELIQRAARGGFNINGANNGIRLPITQHLGSHRKLNQAVTAKLDGILGANQNISNVDAARVVQGYVDQIRAGLMRSSNKLR